MKFENSASLIDVTLFLFAFCFVVSAGLVLQFLIVPALFDAPSTEVGLIPGIDAFGFHTIVVHQAEMIRANGWHMWELRPEGQGPAGVASIFYTYLPNHPAVLLPLHGAVFAAAIVFARHILEAILKDRTAALFALAPLFLFPSFVVVWGQLHKDLFTGAGLFLILLSAVSAFSERNRTTFVLLGVISGSLLVVMMRPYALAIIAVATLPFLFVALRGGMRTFLRMATIPLLVFSVFLIDSQVTEGKNPARGGMGAVQELAGTAEQACRPLPGALLVDQTLFRLCVLRHRFHSGYRDATSNIDTDVRLRSASDYLFYAPQAIVVAALRPFPTEILQARSAVGRAGSMLAAGEMIFAYAAFGFALVLGYRKLRDPYLLAMIAGLMIFILVYVYAIPNLGTLYRMRIFAFTLLVSLSVGLVVSSVRKIRRSLQSRDENRYIATEEKQ